MKEHHRKKSNPPPLGDAYDLHLIEQIEAQLALASEIAELAKELNSYMTEIERAFQTARKIQVIPLTPRPN